MLHSGGGLLRANFVGKDGRTDGSVKPDELKGEPFLMRESGSGGREILESALLLHGIELEPTWESISTQAITQGVASGFGVAVLPLLLVEPYLTQGTLVTRPIEGISLKRRFAIIHHKNKYISDIMREFIDLCRAWNGKNSPVSC
jgi:DNA-binding transcriptional LysR family regulator